MLRRFGDPLEGRSSPPGTIVCMLYNLANPAWNVARKDAPPSSFVLAMLHPSPPTNGTAPENTVNPGPPGYIAVRLQKAASSITTFAPVRAVPMRYRNHSGDGGFAGSRKTTL